MGDPTDFFFFRMITGGGVRRAGFWNRVDILSEVRTERYREDNVSQ